MKIQKKATQNNAEATQRTFQTETTTVFYVEKINVTKLFADKFTPIKKNEFRKLISLDGCIIIFPNKILKYGGKYNK